MCHGPKQTIWRHAQHTHQDLAVTHSSIQHFLFWDVAINSQLAYILTYSNYGSKFHVSPSTDPSYGSQMHIQSIYLLIGKLCFQYFCKLRGHLTLQYRFGTYSGTHWITRTIRKAFKHRGTNHIWEESPVGRGGCRDRLHVPKTRFWTSFGLVVTFGQDQKT